MSFIQKKVVALLFLLIITTLGPAAAYAGDGFLKLYNIHTRERLHINYTSKNKPSQKIQARINHFFRCRYDNSTVDIDMDLIKLLDDVQDFFDSDSEIQVLSGYRSNRFNQFLKRKGRSVASRSYHMRGQAVDFRIPGIPLAQVRDFVWSLQHGGVGYYRNNFIHIDTGPVRNWPARYFKTFDMEHLAGVGDKQPVNEN